MRLTAGCQVMPVVVRFARLASCYLIHYYIDIRIVNFYTVEQICIMTRTIIKPA